MTIKTDFFGQLLCSILSLTKNESSSGLLRNKTELNWKYLLTLNYIKWAEQYKHMLRGIMYV